MVITMAIIASHHNPAIIRSHFASDKEATNSMEHLHHLDSVLRHVITTVGWPHWETSAGRGPGLPSRPLHIFGVHPWTDSARIDFYRGISEDD